jgi:hypothetical protein
MTTTAEEHLCVPSSSSSSGSSASNSSAVSACSTGAQWIRRSRVDPREKAARAASASVVPAISEAEFDKMAFAGHCRPVTCVAAAATLDAVVKPISAKSEQNAIQARRNARSSIARRQLTPMLGGVCPTLARRGQAREGLKSAKTCGNCRSRTRLTSRVQRTEVLAIRIRDDTLAVGGQRTRHQPAESRDAGRIHDHDARSPLAE